ncbi:F-box domain protein [Pandoravirus inopinatum]|uniref:F-box domain protein n=1 Tax=Pandoravirus inopinatum TaxID=1605721 RepID=A0A0B5IY90_9VIRU|nr:F-box domain protein [Pandoravirus inopinatum]AJF97808.1 F-box domain protein [Pandoravirus inopinatum]
MWLWSHESDFFFRLWARCVFLPLSSIDQLPQWDLWGRLCQHAKCKKKRWDIVVFLSPPQPTARRLHAHTMATTTTHAIVDVPRTGLLALPDEILLAVIAMCTGRPGSLARIGSVCRQFYRLCDDDALWKPIVARMAGLGATTLTGTGSRKALAHAIRSTTIAISAHLVDTSLYEPDPEHILKDLPHDRSEAVVALEHVVTPFRLACMVAHMRRRSPMHVHLWIKARHADSFRLIWAPCPSAPLLDGQPWWSTLMACSARDDPPDPSLAIVVAVVCCHDGVLNMPPCVAAAAISTPVDLHDGHFPQVEYAVACGRSTLTHLPDCSCLDKK